MIKFNMAPTARKLVEYVMAVKSGEKALIVTDSGRSPHITEALAHAIAGAGAELAIVHMPPRMMGGIDPPLHVGAAIQASDVTFLQLSYATFHTDTIRTALDGGTRTLEMWGFEEEMMVVGGANVDYPEMEALSLDLTERMTRAKTARFTTPEGSDMTFSLEGREAFALMQTAREAGEHCACPGGEATVCPVLGSAEGVMVSPFCIEHKELGQITDPMRLEVKGGNVVSITGSAAADRFWRIVEDAGELAHNVAEFAFGTNSACRKRVTVREAKKALGTCHVAFGDSRSLAGEINTPLHVDMIYDNPTVWLDDEMVMKDGKPIG